MPKLPSTLYKKLVDGGRLSRDASQAEILEQMDALTRLLDGYAPSQATMGLGWLLRRNTDRVAPRSVYIWGDVGRGKTLIMDLLHEAIKPVSKRRIHFHAFMQDVHGDIHTFRKAQDKGLVDQSSDPIAAVASQIADEANVLCLDEFQVKDITDAMILGRLFDALLKRGCVVIVTSNIAPDELYRNGLNRNLFEPFIDLIERQFDIIQLNGTTDYRLEKLSGEKLYICPLGPGAAGRMKLMWRKVTGAGDAPGSQLEVKGRVLKVPHAARGAAWFSFADLCEQPLGQADYLAIAREFKIVFIENVPELDESQGNAARRFINLIDSLYDHHAKLVISAETPPQGIYRFASTPIEFARTVSRLSEMQSAEWWQQS